MNETIALNADEDKYADMQAHYCEACPLPQLVFDYENGFKLLNGMLNGLRAEVQRLVNKIDELEHNRNI